MKLVLLTGLMISLPLGALAGGPQDPPDINFAFKVDKAIDKGMAYLLGKRTSSYHRDIKNGNELILLTYLHAGAPEGYPTHKADFEALLKEALEEKLERTYKVVLQAMSLEEYNRAKYQWRIHQCAQFLADNIGSNGETRYGQPSIFTEDIEPTPTVAPRRSVKTSGRSTSRYRSRRKAPEPEPHRRVKPPVPRIIQVKRQRPGEADKDHSNMQYMALGLRACHDAGIRFEKTLLQTIYKNWISCQKKGEGEKREALRLDPPRKGGLSRPRPGATQASYAARGKARGWCYGNHDHKAYGSMSAGAVGALCILDYMLGKDWRKDQNVLDGLQWINKNFSVTGNPGPYEHANFAVNSKSQYYYYMYGLERAGMLFGTEVIGDHKWYREGAEQLLKDQAGDGGWGSGVVQTCFAILFLRRATRRLDVATGGGR